jgi:hypothetical protein
MEIRIMPINYSLLFGDAASQTFPATAAGTYTLSTPLAAGLYEITTDNSQSSFTLGIQTESGYRFTGTIRGGKGYISVPVTSTKIVIPAGMTYPANINIRLGSYTMLSAPTSVSSSFPVVGVDETVEFTAPLGSTDIVAYWRNGSSTAFSSTTSPKTSLTNPTITATGQTGYILLVAKDANGVTGLGVETASTNTATYFPITGGTITTYSSGGTNYVVNTFTGSGSLIVSSTSTINYLVVGGGGACGGGTGTASWNGVDGGSGGGGGGGGLRTGSVSVPAGTYSVTVGAGGTHITSGSTATQGFNGGTSTLAFPTPIVAAGGGGGGVYGGVDNGGIAGRSAPATNGGGGGGSGMSYGGGNASGGAGVLGYAGGAGQQWGNQSGAGGGGGGMGAAGTAAQSNGGTLVSNGKGYPGNGGIGVTNSIRTGSPVYYSGGGGGGQGSMNNSAVYSLYGQGGAGGGGSGLMGNFLYSLLPGTPNSGGGGGAGIGGGYFGTGGSGIIVVRTVI